MVYNRQPESMKKIVFFFLTFCFIAFTHAQTPVAMLDNGGTLLPYYGTDALINAYNDANEGSTITLSPGIFNACDIQKNITIRGAGMMMDEANAILPTTIDGNFTIHNTDSTKSMVFEGLFIEDYVYFDTVWNVQFIKCYAGRIAHNSMFTSAYHNGTFLHCILPAVYCRMFKNCHFYNSVFGEPNDNSVDLWNSDQSTVFTNCILKFHATNINTFHSTNCIMMGNDTNHTTGTGNPCLKHYYGIGITTSESPFFHPEEILVPQHLYNFSTCAEVFVNFNRNIAVTSDYHLLDNVAELYLGSDSTQIGIYGGQTPFNPRVNNPSIGRITVGGETDSQGRLPVSIEVINE